MKAVVVYFQPPVRLPKPRRHHEVPDKLIAAWVHCYRRSGTPFPPVMLTDETTPVPDPWPFDVVRLDTAAPPRQKDVLHKVGWMKAQAHATVGPCVVLDLDAFVLKNIAPLADFPADLGMAPDDGPPMDWHKQFPEVGHKYNAGVVVMKGPVWAEFQFLWHSYWDRIGQVTYFDEVLLTILCRRIGSPLDRPYNKFANGPDDLDSETARVLHFPGGRKPLLGQFYRKLAL